MTNPESGLLFFCEKPTSSVTALRGFPHNRGRTLLLSSLPNIQKWHYIPRFLELLSYIWCQSKDTHAHIHTHTHSPKRARECGSACGHIITVAGAVRKPFLRGGRVEDCDSIAGWGVCIPTACLSDRQCCCQTDNANTIYLFLVCWVRGSVSIAHSIHRWIYKWSTHTCMTYIQSIKIGVCIGMHKHIANDAYKHTHTVSKNTTIYLVKGLKISTLP